MGREIETYARNRGLNGLKGRMQAEKDFDAGKDIALQTKALAYYLLSRYAVGLEVNYESGWVINEQITRVAGRIKPLAESFSSMGDGRDFEMRYGDYENAEQAVESLPHDIVWTLGNTVPLLDPNGNSRFSRHCIKSIGKYNVRRAIENYILENDIHGDLPDEIIGDIEERVVGSFTEEISRGLSKEFRAIFNTFPFVLSG